MKPWPQTNDSILSMPTEPTKRKDEQVKLNSYYDGIVFYLSAFMRHFFFGASSFMLVGTRLLCLTAVLTAVCSHAATAQPSGRQSNGREFTLQQVMSAPFNSDLIAAPAKDRLAWLSNVEGRRNIWVATHLVMAVVMCHIKSHSI